MGTTVKVISISSVLRILICQSIVCLFACSSGAAQTHSTLGQFDEKPRKHRAPTKIAQQSPKKNPEPQSSPKKTDQKKPAPVSNKRRAELMEFVNDHHPEIRPLLNSLRKTQQAKFHAALRTLDRDVKNIQALEKRSPERHARSLEQWTVKSKIKLLAARLAMKKSQKNSQAIKDELKDLIERQLELRLEQANEDLIATRKRLERLETLQNELKNQEKLTEQQLGSITKNAQRLLATQKKAAEAKKRAKVNRIESSKKETKKPGDAKNE